MRWADFLSFESLFVMKKLLLVFVFLITFVSSKASHIVGGEFELLYLFGNTYRLNMILYFDEINGTPGAEDGSVTIRIFRKRDNAIMLNGLTLPLTSRSDVEYTQLECSNGEIVTDRLLYTTTVVLSPSIYDDPEGYYIAWERCCRNYQITNIYSEPQPGGPRFAGQAFYLEFPPIVKNGQPFINNSPRLFPPLNDFACPGIPYYVDFAGVDDDGDSLVYSLVTPLNTFTADAFPLPNPPGLPRPGPYPEVEWRPGFGLDNILNGVTNLEISEDGFLTVTPNSLGLYVFAVRCEEFRAGVRIGEVRRDFQMLVVDACPVPVPPVIVGKELDEPVFGTTGTLSVSFDNTTPDNERCFEVKVTDPSTLLPDDNNQENIKIKAIPLSFKGNINEILPAITTATITNGGEAIFRICFPSDCPYNPSGIFEVGIIAFDDACSLPLSDTLRVSVYIEPPSNQPPQFNNPGGLTTITATVQEGDPLQTWPLQVLDADGDALIYRLVPMGFVLPDVGMSFNGALAGQQASPLNKQLTWDPKCDVYDFTQKTNFKLYFIIDDIDQCLFPHADTTTFNLTIDLPGNADPLINNNLEADIDTLEITHKIYGAPIQINVTGNDADVDDVIVLRGNGIGFNASAYGVSFPKVSGNGTVASQFNWALTCPTINLDEKDIFEFNLQVVDSTNKCGFYKADTLHLIVHVEPPDNESPDLLITSDNVTTPIIDGSILIILGDSIELTLTGTDVDLQPTDVLKLELFSQAGNVEPEGYTFAEGEGEGPLSEAFSWNADCSIFENGVFENNYTFTFLLSDNRCFNEKGDTVTLNMTIRDVDGGDQDFLPPNVFSPNRDDKNDFFAMVKESETPGEFVNILPLDNCMGEFIRATIYDRWGKQVYESFSRDFRWYAEGMPVGVYYYYLKYSNRDYKGIVSLRL